MFQSRFPMDKNLRKTLLKNIPDIRVARDLAPRDTINTNPADSSKINLSDGERFWLTSAATLIHRQLLQILSISTLLAQEFSINLGLTKDGTSIGLSPQGMAELCGSLTTLTADSIRTVMGLQRSRLAKAMGKRLPASGADYSRAIFSEKCEDAMAKQAERDLNLSMARPSTLIQISGALKSGDSRRGEPRTGWIQHGQGLRSRSQHSTHGLFFPV